MKDIEKLAIECGAEYGTWDKSGNGYFQFSFNSTQLEAFAKALQQSEPVAEFIEPQEDVDSFGSVAWLLNIGEPLKNGDLLYCTPQPSPDTVPVEKYNKLLEAIIQATQSSCRGYEDWIAIRIKLQQAIAEAEGK